MAGAASTARPWLDINFVNGLCFLGALGIVIPNYFALLEFLSPFGLPSALSTLCIFALLCANGFVNYLLNIDFVEPLSKRKIADFQGKEPKFYAKILAMVLTGTLFAFTAFFIVPKTNWVWQILAIATGVVAGVITAAQEIEVLLDEREKKPSTTTEKTAESNSCTATVLMKALAVGVTFLFSVALADGLMNSLLQLHLSHTAILAISLPAVFFFAFFAEFVFYWNKLPENWNRMKENLQHISKQDLGQRITIHGSVFLNAVTNGGLSFALFKIFGQTLSNLGLNWIPTGHTLLILSYTTAVIASLASWVINIQSVPNRLIENYQAKGV